MNSFLHFLFVASAACLACAINLEHFAAIFPMLKNIHISTCPPNEIYKLCLRKSSNCEQRAKYSELDCSKSGCDCMEHFVRLTPNGSCVHVSQCPKPQCDENEIFRECGPYCEACSSLPCRIIKCEYKCYCKMGYLRNSEGACIPAEDCPKRPACGHNEEWAESGLINEYCLTQEEEEPNEEKQNVSKCYCKDGFKRNAMGICMNITLCSNIKCLGKETYYNCIPNCNATCHSLGDPNCEEDDNCYAGCFCPPEEAMNNLRSCIPVKNCTAGVSSTTKVIHKFTTVVEDDTSDSDSTTEFTINDNTDTSVSTYYPDTDETSEDDQIGETSSISEASEKESDTEPSVSPPTTAKETHEKDYSTAKASSSDAKETRGKDYSTAKSSSSAKSSKHANAAASSKASRQKVPEDSDNE